MSESSDTTAPRRRNRRRKAPAAAAPRAEPAVRAILEQALHPDQAALDAETGDGADAPAAPVARPRRGRRKPAAEPAAESAAETPPKPPAPRKRRRRGASPPAAEAAEAVVERAVEDVAPGGVVSESDAVESDAVESDAVESVALECVAAESVIVAAAAAPETVAADVPAAIAAWPEATECWSPAQDIAATAEDAPAELPADEAFAAAEAPSPDDAGVDADPGAAPGETEDGAVAEALSHEPPPPEPPGHPPEPPPGPPPASPAAAPGHPPVAHGWVYLAVGLFLTALGFGLWGVWNVFFTDGDAQTMAATRARADRLSQEVSTLRRSDQISRDANRDLERTLAERDEEIASLRADIAFYERFVGATGQRRGLSVHTLEMRRQDGDAWHFVATLTQNVNRGAVNDGRLALSVEGTRGDRMEKLSWSTLRKQANAPGQSYSFKYFQQLEGEILLPADFKPLRVTVRLVPQSGSAVEQSFPWPETLHSAAGG